MVMILRKGRQQRKESRDTLHRISSGAEKSENKLNVQTRVLKKRRSNAPDTTNHREAELVYSDGPTRQ